VPSTAVSLCNHKERKPSTDYAEQVSPF
jgi:hypothetical protein